VTDETRAGDGGRTKGFLIAGVSLALLFFIAFLKGRAE
jgi:hypothetical protein